MSHIDHTYFAELTSHLESALMISFMITPIIVQKIDFNITH